MARHRRKSGTGGKFLLRPLFRCSPVPYASVHCSHPCMPRPPARSLRSVHSLVHCAPAQPAIVQQRRVYLPRCYDVSPPGVDMHFSSPSLPPPTICMRLPRHSSLVCLLAFIAIPPLTFLILFLGYLHSSMRVCLPFSLTRLSTTAHNTFSCQARPVSSIVMNNTAIQSTAAEGRLAGFLSSQRDLFLQDLKDGKGKGWTVVMGNQAGGEYTVFHGRVKLNIHRS